jgi:molecular chaperone IbpA
MVNTTVTYSGNTFPGLQTFNSLFNDPFFIGFQPNINTWSHVTRQENYPPYNVIKQDEDTYLVELALAGFDRSDLTVTADNGNLIVKGEKESKDVEFQHKGIATRSFTRSFALGEYMEVTGAEFENGMLAVTVERIVPEEKKPKSIKIK